MKNFNKNAEFGGILGKKNSMECIIAMEYFPALKMVT